MNFRIIKILGILGLIIALAIVTSILPSQPQLQAMPSDVEDKNQVTEEQASPQNQATATITITWTTAPNDNEVCEKGPR